MVSSKRICVLLLISIAILLITNIIAPKFGFPLSMAAGLYYMSLKSSSQRGAKRSSLDILKFISVTAIQNLFLGGAICVLLYYSQFMICRSMAFLLNWKYCLEEVIITIIKIEFFI